MKIALAPTSFYYSWRAEREKERKAYSEKPQLYCGRVSKKVHSQALSLRLEKQRDCDRLWMEGHYLPVTGFQNRDYHLQAKTRKRLNHPRQKIGWHQNSFAVNFYSQGKTGKLEWQILKTVEDSSLVKVLYSYAAINTSRVDHKKIAATLHNRSWLTPGLEITIFFRDFTDRQNDPNDVDSTPFSTNTHINLSFWIRRYRSP